MAREWGIGIAPLQGLVARLEDGQALEWRPYHEAVYKAALVERLEAIVEELEGLHLSLDARLNYGGKP